MNNFRIVLKVALLACFSYFLGLLLISGLFHRNDNFSVLKMRTLEYVQESWVGFLISIFLVSLIVGRDLLRPQGLFRKFAKSLLSVHAVAALTGLIFFIKQTLLKGNVQTLSELFSMLGYSIQQTGVGLFYCLPATVFASVLLSSFLKRQ